jgi:hypothetical protein
LEPLPAADACISVDSEQEITAALRLTLFTLERERLSTEGLSKASETRLEFHDAFDAKLGIDPLANILPLLAKLKPGVSRGKGTQRT